MSAALPDDPSVLEEFGVAKRKIADIFAEIDQQMEAVQTFFQGHGSSLTYFFTFMFSESYFQNNFKLVQVETRLKTQVKTSSSLLIISKWKLKSEPEVKS